MFFCIILYFTSAFYFASLVWLSEWALDLVNNKCEIKQYKQNKISYMNSTALFSQYQINCFTMEHPMHCSSSSDGLLIADTAHHIYKFNFNQPGKQREGLEHSLEVYEHELSQQDLGSMLGLNINSNHSSLDLSFHMDVQMEVLDCNYQIMEVDQLKIEVLTVLGTKGQFKMWSKYANHTQYTLVPIQHLQKIQNFADFGFYNSSNSKLPSLIILEHEQQNGLLKVHKLQPTFTPTSLCMKQTKQPIIIENQACFSSHPKLVDKCRMVGVQNRLLGIYNKFQIVLHGIKQLARTIKCGSQYVIYGDGNSAWVLDRKQQLSICAVKDKSVLDLKFVELDQVFACLTHSPVVLYIHSTAGHLLWSLDLQHIQSPLAVRQTSEEFRMQILDSQKIKLYELSKSCLLTSAPQINCPIQQQKVHLSTATTLKHRMQILRTLQSYANNQDYASLLRYLENCNNNTILNDGLMLIHNRISKLSSSGAKQEKVVLALANILLQETKYQSHLENSLHSILESCKRLKAQGKQDPKIWQECIKIIKEIIGCKKLRKLQQQQKNKRIFQLAYELVHTANSHLLQS